MTKIQYSLFAKCPSQNSSLFKCLRRECHTKLMWSKIVLNKVRFVSFMLKGRRPFNPYKTLRAVERGMSIVNASSTHRGDSWPGPQPPCWHSGDSCGSVPCAPPVNCAACSFVHSSCTCEVYPLRRDVEISVLPVSSKAKLIANFWRCGGSIYRLFRLKSLPPPHS